MNIYPADRFIQERRDNWPQIVDLYNHELIPPSTNPVTQLYLNEVYKACNGHEFKENHSLFNLGRQTVRQPHSTRHQLMEFHREQAKREATLRKEREWRSICTAPLKTLDAPEIKDDYYLSLLDSSKGRDEHLAVALYQGVYTYNLCTSAILKIDNLSADNYFSTVRWLDTSSHLCLGLDTGAFRVHDVVQGRRLLQVPPHAFARMNCAEPYGMSCLFTGHQNGDILKYDVREHKLSRAVGGEESPHLQSICALRLHGEGNFLATGGNDNLVKVWDLRQSRQPLLEIKDHSAAVKALAWSPAHRELLFSGGGSADQTIKITSLNRGCVISSEPGAKSQVTGIHFSQDGRRLVSTHGYIQNSCIVWTFNGGFKKLVEFKAHESRIISSTLVENGTVLVTASGDETLRFWEVFAKNAPHVVPPDCDLEMKHSSMIR